jgi:hypothetical protein
MMTAQWMAIRQSQKQWKYSIANTLAWPRSKAVANFLLLTGRNCFAKYLLSHGLPPPPPFIAHTNQQEKTDRHHLLSCTALSATAESQSYFKSKRRMAEWRWQITCHLHK